MNNRTNGGSLRGVSVALIAGFALAGCNQSAPPPAAATGTVAVAPRGDPARIARGGDLFHQHCASCHGEKAQGAFNWQKPGPDGKYPPPPLNGTAHAWHHPQAALRTTIRNGTLKIGGAMPPWRDTLSDADIDDVILWFQSFWPEELYQAWLQMDADAQRKRSGS